MNAAAELTALRAALADLSGWADDRLNDDYDRQHIAEHLTATIDALISGATPPRRPF